MPLSSDRRATSKQELFDICPLMRLRGANGREKETHLVHASSIESHDRRMRQAVKDGAKSLF